RRVEHRVSNFARTLPLEAARGLSVAATLTRPSAGRCVRNVDGASSCWSVHKRIHCGDRDCVHNSPTCTSVVDHRPSTAQRAKAGQYANIAHVQIQMVTY